VNQNLLCAKHLPVGECLIATNSRSVLILFIPIPSVPKYLSIKIKVIVYALIQAGFTHICFLWISVHTDIARNENADDLAKLRYFITIPLSREIFIPILSYL